MENIIKEAKVELSQLSAQKKCVDEQIDKLMKELEVRRQNHIHRIELDCLLCQTRFYVYDFYNLVGNCWKYKGVFPGNLKALSDEILKRRNDEHALTGGMFVTRGNINVFKIYEAGNDKYGRPGRWVLLLARTRRENVPFSIDLLEVMNKNDIFKQYGEEILPEPSLPELEINWFVREPVSRTISCVDSGKVIATSEITSFSRAMTSPQFFDEFNTGMMFLFERKNEVACAEVVCL